MEDKGKIFNKWVWILMGLIASVYAMVGYLIVSS